MYEKRSGDPPIALVFTGITLAFSFASMVAYKVICTCRYLTVIQPEIQQKILRKFYIGKRAFDVAMSMLM